MEPDIRALTWTQSLKQTGYSLKFRALAYLQEYSPHKIISNNQELFLLGERFVGGDNLTEINKTIYDKFCSIPWVTYRTAFLPLKKSDNGSEVTDSGWGCMIRTGQMYIATALKMNLKLSEKQQMYDVLRLFDDFDENKMFSIQNISKLAKQQYDIEPGSWYNPSQISYIISLLYQNHPNNIYRDFFDILSMHSGSLFFDQIIAKMTGRTQLCKCKKKLIVCHNCYTKKKALSVILLTRIGLALPEQKYLNCLSKMIESPCFSGIIGGKPDKALFIAGKVENRLIYLDPHLVQPAVNQQNFEKQKQTYFCNNFRTCKINSIDPSMGITFYFEKLEDVDEFYHFMNELKRQQPDDFFLYMADETPDYLRQKKEDNKKGGVMEGDQ